MPSPSLLLQDPFFYAFIIASLLLGWTWHLAGSLYTTIMQLELERDSQARTIQWQRRVIAELEKEKEQSKQ